MAKMGFSAPTASFRPSSFCPPCFWFCRSCIQFCSVSSSTKVLCRVDDKASRGAHRGIPNGAIGADVLELNQKSSYSTFQHNENQMLYRERSDFAYTWKKPSFCREAEAIEEEGLLTEVLNTTQTAKDWVKATEEFRMNKRLFAHENNTSTNLKTISEGDNRRNTIYEGERRALRRKEMKYSGNGRQHVHHISQDHIALGQGPSSLGSKRVQVPKPNSNEVFNIKETVATDNEVVPVDDVGEHLSENITGFEYSELHERLGQVYEKVLVVDSILAAREVVHMLTTQYKDLVHACDTEACIGLL